MSLYAPVQKDYRILDQREVIEAKAMWIFQQALIYLKDHFLERWKESTKIDVSEEHFRWVLTVPAIWSDQARLFMREAACEAGIIKNLDAKNLHIALEPEAAALHCKGLNLQQFEGGSSNGIGLLSMPVGTVYMMLDAGGGTVDITVHEIAEDGYVDEIIEPKGAPWGGMCINKAFWKLLVEILGKDIIKKIKKDLPMIWYNIEGQFEQFKRIDHTNFDSLPVITIPFGLAKVFQEETKKDLAEYVNGKGMAGVYVLRWDLCLAKARVDSLFDPTITNIVEYVKHLFTKKELTNVKYIFMVGGFSTSDYLTTAIKKEFLKPGLKVLIPDEPVLAVLRGAVMFGVNPETIRLRIARKTYGVSTVLKFKPGEHEEEKKVKIGGVDKCKDVFCKFITKGTSVKVGCEITREFAPKEADALAVSFDLLCSESDKDPTYSTDSGVEKLGFIYIPMPDTTRGKARRAFVTMKFGGTIIDVTARDEMENVIKRTKIKFYSKPADVP